MPKATTRANYKIGPPYRDLIRQQAARNSRSEGAQVEQLALLQEALDQLVLRESPVTKESIDLELARLKLAIERGLNRD
jgi:hypothetical protein